MAMSNLANVIESYIRRLLDASPNATILLQRRELADRFSCVPSQINYVLSTRFTSERGYLVESRRGGGGYLRIRRLDLSREKVVHIIEMLRTVTDEGVSAQEAFDLVNRLAEARLITRREGLLMQTALEAAGRQNTAEQNHIRAVILARMLEILLHES
jgi:transcriptional regulator of stress and heat shock response